MTEQEDRPDWEKFPYRWCMSDGGLVYFPGGSKHHLIPEEQQELFEERLNDA